MIQPHELKTSLPMALSNDVVSTTSKVWDVLVASKNGDLVALKKMVDDCPELIYAQYNYTPPIHFAVREGHTALVKYLLDNGAHDPDYKIYPFSDSLETIAGDRGYDEIVLLLEKYRNTPSLHKYKGDNGEIHYNRTDFEVMFQKAVNKENLQQTRQLLKDHPGLLENDTFFWGEGILLMPSKAGNFELIKLLLSYGAAFPKLSKWPQFYYFERYDSAEFILEHGMDPNHMTWHHVTILHDMAQKGNIPKAALLLKHGAEIDVLEEEYHSTPLGMAARWGHVEMVEFLLKHGADPNKSVSPWATPLSWAKKKGHTVIERILENAGAI